MYHYQATEYVSGPLCTRPTEYLPGSLFPSPIAYQAHSVPLPGPLCTSYTVTQSHCVSVACCTRPTVYQAHCVPVTLCPSPMVYQLHGVPVPLCASPMVSQAYGVPGLFCIKLDGLSEKHCVPSPQYGLCGGNYQLTV